MGSGNDRLSGKSGARLRAPQIRGTNCGSSRAGRGFTTYPRIAAELTAVSARKKLDIRRKPSSIRSIDVA